MKDSKFKLTTPPKLPPKPSGTLYAEGNLDAPHGWLSPSGVFHPCKYGDHDWAAEFIHLEMGEANEKMCDPSGGPDNWYQTPTTILERKSWIKIQKFEPWVPGHVRIDDEWFVTKDQFRFINDYLANRGVTDMMGLNLRIK